MYTLKTIQRELITVVYQNMNEELKKEFHSAMCFRVIMDEASDLGIEIRSQ